jgi:hypothetical protein
MREVPVITAYLFHRGGDQNPAQLVANKGKMEWTPILRQPVNP